MIRFNVYTEDGAFIKTYYRKDAVRRFILHDGRSSALGVVKMIPPAGAIHSFSFFDFLRCYDKIGKEVTTWESL